MINELSRLEERKVARIQQKDIDRKNQEKAEILRDN
jgi:hypothetical protein